MKSVRPKKGWSTSKSMRPIDSIYTYFYLILIFCDLICPLNWNRQFNLISILQNLAFSMSANIANGIWITVFSTRIWTLRRYYNPMHNMLVLDRNGQCLLSDFFCPLSKMAQPKYAKGASEEARSPSVYGILENLRCWRKV